MRFRLGSLFVLPLVQSCVRLPSHVGSLGFSCSVMENSWTGRQRVCVFLAVLPSLGVSAVRSRWLCWKSSWWFPATTTHGDLNILFSLKRSSVQSHLDSLIIIIIKTTFREIETHWRVWKATVVRSWPSRCVLGLFFLFSPTAAWRRFSPLKWCCDFQQGAWNNTAPPAGLVRNHMVEGNFFLGFRVRFFFVSFIDFALWRPLLSWTFQCSCEQAS